MGLQAFAAPPSERPAAKRVHTCLVLTRVVTILVFVLAPILSGGWLAEVCLCSCSPLAAQAESCSDDCCSLSDAAVDAPGDSCSAAVASTLNEARNAHEHCRCAGCPVVPEIAPAPHPSLQPRLGLAGLGVNLVDNAPPIPADIGPQTHLARHSLAQGRPPPEPEPASAAALRSRLCIRTI